MKPPSMDKLLQRLRELLARNPRAIRFVLVLGVVALAGIPLMRLVPRGTTIDYDLGEQHGQVVMLRFAYLPVGQDAARAITVRFPNGAPRHYEHHVELAPGRYEVHARVVAREGEHEVTGYLTVPASEAVSIPLYQRSIFDY